MEKPDLVEYFLISVLLMCALLFVKPDLYLHIGKMDARMLTQ